MDGESLNLKSKFKTLIDKTKKNVSGGVGGNDLASGHDILSTAADSIALAAAERDRRSRKAFGLHPPPARRRSKSCDFSGPKTTDFVEKRKWHRYFQGSRQ